MASVNLAIIVGNLGRDPETRSFPSGDMVANFSIATTEKWRDRNTGENKEATSWHSIVCNGKLAEVAANYLRKGSQVYIEGSIKQRSYEKDGVTHYVTEIRANKLQLLGPRSQGHQQDQGYSDDGYGYEEPPRQQQRQAPAQNQQRQQAQGQQRQQGNSYQNGRGNY